MRKLKEIVRFGTDFRAKSNGQIRWLLFNPQNKRRGFQKRSMKQMRSKTQNR